MMTRKELEESLKRLEKIIGIKVARPKLEKGARLYWLDLEDFSTSWNGVTGFNNELKGIIGIEKAKYDIGPDVEYYYTYKGNVIGYFSYRGYTIRFYSDKDIRTIEEQHKLDTIKEREQQLSTFENQAKYLNSRFSLLSLEEILEILKKEFKNRKKGK